MPHSFETIKPQGSQAFLSAVANRRTYYGITKARPIEDSRLKEVIEACIKHTPSSFNQQSARVALLLDDKSVDLWQEVKTEFLKTLGDDAAAIALYTKKIDEYAAGYGTVLFFEDQAVLEAWGKNMPPLAETFKVWSGQSSGMLQFAVWTALETEGLGASLQHYNAFGDVFENLVRKAAGAPDSWKPLAMMPIGTPNGPPGNPAHPKTFEPIENRFKVIS